MKQGLIQTIIIATVGLLVTTYAFALEKNLLQGLYLGGSLGESILTMQESVVGSGNATVVDAASGFLLSGTVPLSNHANMVKNSVLGQLYAGYGFISKEFYSKQFYLSGEVAVHFANGVTYSDRGTGLSEELSFGGPTVELTGSTSSVNSKASISPTQFSILARPGVLFKTNGLLFGKVGANFSSLSYQVITSSTNRIFGYPSDPLVLTTSSRQQRTSLLLGGGLEYVIFNRWSLRADYTYINYGGLSTNVNRSIPLVINDGTGSNENCSFAHT